MLINVTENTNSWKLCQLSVVHATPKCSGMKALIVQTNFFNHNFMEFLRRLVWTCRKCKILRPQPVKDLHETLTYFLFLKAHYASEMLSFLFLKNLFIFDIMLRFQLYLSAIYMYCFFSPLTRLAMDINIVN
jgi:hypothetical protein